MKSTKPEKIVQQKIKGKSISSSKEAIKFIERGGGMQPSFKFSNIATSLNDFLPESTLVDVDSDIVHVLKRLDKKDSLTKQKALSDLLDILPKKDAESVINCLKFWPKLYVKLSFDEEKSIREMCQDVMGCFVRICGKNISSYVKQLLPTWIIAQSDLHLPSAKLASQSFRETFKDESKRQKAYLLCWKELYQTISQNLMKLPLKFENSNSSLKEDEYIENISISIRTLTILLPHLRLDEMCSNDFMVLVKSKPFWAHFKSDCSLIQLVYLQFFSDFIDHYSNTILDNSFIMSNICECLRMADNFNPMFLSILWTCILKCTTIFKVIAWKFVSFKSVFLSKLIKLLESGADGHISLIDSILLPFMVHMPLDIANVENNGVFEQIFSAINSGLVCNRVLNSESEANSMIKVLFECSIYVVTSARNVGNVSLSDKIVESVLEYIVSYLTDRKYRKSTKTLSEFCTCILKPIITKKILSESVFIDRILQWINEHSGNLVFCENLADLLGKIKSIDNMNVQLFNIDLLKQLHGMLINKILHDNQGQCIILYFSVYNSVQFALDHNCTKSDLDILDKCADVIIPYNVSATTSTIAAGIANIINRKSKNVQSDYQRFLSSFYDNGKTDLFFRSFYTEFFNHLSVSNRSVVANISVNIWLDRLSSTFDKEDDSDTMLSILREIYRHCNSLSEHKQHLSAVVLQLDKSLSKAVCQTVPLHSLEQFLDAINLTIETAGSFVVPPSLIDIFIKIVCCVDDKNSNLKMFGRYVSFCVDNQMKEVLCHLVDETIQSKYYDDNRYETIIRFLVCIVNECYRLDECKNAVEEHIGRLLIKAIVDVEKVFITHYQYTRTYMTSKQHELVMVLHRLNVLLPLIVDNQKLVSIRNLFTDACLLIWQPAQDLFANVQTANVVLDRLEPIHRYVQQCIIDETLQVVDNLLRACLKNSKIDDTHYLLYQCPTLAVHALLPIIPSNFSKWSLFLTSSIDAAVLLECQTHTLIDVLISAAIHARYLVQDSIIPLIASFLTPDNRLSINCVNRAIRLCAALCRADPSAYFLVLCPLIIEARSIIEAHLDDNEILAIDALLEFYYTGIDGVRYHSSVDSMQWEFILCLVGALVRSSVFTDCITNGSDKDLICSCWLLRLIGTITVAMASTSSGEHVSSSVIDEWDNFFMDSIFTAVLDQFAIVSGSQEHGSIVYRCPMVQFFVEALADSVSVCPVPVLLQHDFNAQIDINDPLDLPRDILATVNHLLASLSNHSLAVQLAAHNCLVNIVTDRLPDVLADLISRSESSIDRPPGIVLPYQLLCYLDVHNLPHTDTIDGQFLLLRSLLSWNVLLQLITASPPKVRAELSSLIITTNPQQPNNLFYTFLSFCFSFMPKNPLINKSQFSVVPQHRSILNLVADEPSVLADRCLDDRNKFLIYHLSTHIFRRSMQVLPSLSRQWWLSLQRSSQELVEVYVRNHVTPVLCQQEFGQLQTMMTSSDDDKLTFNAVPAVGEVTIRYSVGDDQTVEQLIQLPSNYPIGKVTIQFKRDASKHHENRWNSWIIQMTTMMQNQNGSVLDGARLLKKNLDSYFSGVEECMICYAVLHGMKYTLPSMKCRQCRKKFHKECMHKWFQSSPNATCPNCRHTFYDGTYKRGEQVLN